MVRAASMEKIMGLYSHWGWDQAWGRTYRPRPEYLQRAENCQDQNDLEPPKSIIQGGAADYPQMTRQPCQTLNGFASLETLEQDGDTEDDALAGLNSTGSWNSAYRPDGEADGHSEEGASACARQETVYAGDAHCAALAKLLQGAR